MADQNLYKHDVDFAALALQDAAFNRHLKSNGQLDFSNPEAVSQLTKSLLKRDFGLEVDLPTDRLCPPVPNRFNYILWIQELIDSTSKDYTHHYDHEREVVGLDIGTGASCIYALLGCVSRPAWKFAVTDVDSKNMDYAKRNVLKNKLKSRIRPLEVEPSKPLIPLDDLGLQCVDFTICNPPFYSSASELEACAKSKSRPPSSACTGADIEMVTPGGEVAFVSRMVDESRHLRYRCQWYTSMLGKASSVEAMVNKLKDAGVDNWAVKDLIQGNKTKRWAVAWSWSDFRPTEAVARSTSTFPKSLLPFPPESTWSSPFGSIDQTTQRLNQTMAELGLRWMYKPAISTGLALAAGNVWSRAARRRREQGQSVGESSNEQGSILGVKVQVILTAKSEVNISIRWVQGRDSVLFESFCGMLKRQLTPPT